MTSLCLLTLAVFSFQANAELWLIGAISPDGWDPSKGVQFTQVDDNNYTLDLQVNSTGNQYYSLTTKLAASSNDWDAIKAYRFGGSKEVKLDTETVLEAGTDNSPYTNFTQTGTYTFEFNISTMVLKVSLKEEVVVPGFNGTIYITKTSTGNIWAWDADGNYFDTWPGKAINTLETATKNGAEYYTFTYTHNASGPGLIFNDGSAQTGNLIPEDGKLYNYTGGTTVEVTDIPAEAKDPSLSLRGSFNEWGETPMTLADGKWTITQEMEAGAEFKFFDENENWIGGEADGNFVVTKEQVEEGTEITLVVGGGNNFQIPVAGTWTLTVDKENNKLVISGEWKEVTIEPSLSLRGSFNEWGETPMTLQNDKWTITQEMEAGAEFKFFDENSNWIGGEADGNFVVTKEQVEEGTELTLVVGGGNNFQIPVAGTWTLSVDKENNKLVISGEWKEETPEPALYLLGSFNEWNEENPEALTLGEDGKWTITKEMEADAEFKFKDENGNWIGGEADGNFIVTKEQVEEGTELTLVVGGGNNFQIPVAGTWTLTIDKENNKLVISGEWKEVTPEPAFYLLGSFNEWNEENPEALTLGEDGKWTITKEMEANAEFKFKDENGNWIGGEADGNFIVTEEQVEEGTELTLVVNGGNNFQIPVAGTWTFTLDPENMTLVIAGEWNEEYSKVYILGEVNDNGGWFPNVGTEMETTDGEIYTAYITTKGENVPEDEEIGYSYFSFTTQLAENDDEGGWAYIEPYRFGAESDGDFWVTDETMGIDITLTTSNYQAFRVPAGNYSLKLNLNAMTLVINKGVRGDVNGDGMVDVTDVSLTIDMVLGKVPENLATADLDGNGTIDVSDVSAIIDIVLGR